MSRVAGASEQLARAGSRGRRLIIWRHGETTHNAAGIWQGQLDAPLSERGIEQARAAAPAVAAYEPSIIVSSDLQRADRTAATLGALVELPVRRDPRFREINVGVWSGMTTAQVLRQWPEVQAAISRGEDPRRGETGETVEEVAVRSHAGLIALLQELEDRQTAVVTAHGVSGRAMAAALTGIDQHTAWMSLSGLGNCHWITLVEAASGWRIEEWNAHS